VTDDRAAGVAADGVGLGNEAGLGNDAGLGAVDHEGSGTLFVSGDAALDDGSAADVVLVAFDAVSSVVPFPSGVVAECSPAESLPAVEPVTRREAVP